MRDHGPGIPRGFAPRALDRSPAPTPGAPGGAGLGLAIVAAIARPTAAVRLRDAGPGTDAVLTLPGQSTRRAISG